MELAKFDSTLVYQKTAPVELIRQDLIQLRGYDKTHEKSAKRWLTIALLCMPLTIAGLILFWPAGVVTVVVMIVSFLIYGHHANRNIEDRRYETANNVLFLIGHDIGKDVPVNVTIDLRPTTHASKLKNTGKVGVWSVKYFDDPWLSVSGKLLDGTSFDCSLTDMLQKKSAWKRGRSGKNKYKSKEKSRLRADLRLRVKAKEYPGLETVAANAREAIKTPYLVEVRDFSCADCTLKLATESKAPWDSKLRMETGSPNRSGPEIVSMMFLSLYQILNFARQAK